MAACVHSSSTPEYGPRSTLSGAQTSGAIFGRFFGFARWDDESVQPFKNRGLTVRRKLQFKMRGARNEVSYPRKKEKKKENGETRKEVGGESVGTPGRRGEAIDGVGSRKKENTFHADGRCWRREGEEKVRLSVLAEK